MENVSKPTTTYTNTAKVLAAVTWDTWNDVTWATETRTWDELASNFDGFSKPTTTMTNVAKP